MKKLLLVMAFGFAASMPAAFAAVEADQVRGDIVSVNSADSTIRVRVTESGDERDAAVGSVQTFNVPENTPIEYEIDRTIYARSRTGGTDLSDLSEGDTVLLKFEDMQGVRQATNVRNERTTNTVARERVRREGRVVQNAESSQNESVAMRSANERRSLPASASPLPLLALFGVFFAGLGTLLRCVRQ